MNSKYKKALERIDYFIYKVSKYLPMNEEEYELLLHNFDVAKDLDTLKEMFEKGEINENK